MAQPVKPATPLDAVTGPEPPVLVQVSTPLLGLLLIDRKSVVEGKSVDLGGRRIIKKKDAGKRAVPVAWMLAPEVGWLVTTSFVAVPGVMLKLLGLLGALCGGLFEAVSV